VTRRRTPRETGKKAEPHTDAGQSLAREFSDIELLAAADVIRPAIAEGRHHVDQDALRRVLAKLTAAYASRKRSEA